MLGIIEDTVSIRQARKALYQLGYLDLIEQYMATAPREVQLDWEFATEVRRGHPLVIQMVELLGVTEQDINNLFLLAHTL